jgi:deoxyribonucleoside regulator
MMLRDEMLAVRAAELYYDENKTQDEIGTLLNLTRWKVGRLLSDAREQGIIRIEIMHPRARKLSLERELRDATGLKTAIVVPAGGDAEEVQSRVALAAADFLTSLRPAPRTLGVSWGRTLHEVAQSLRPGWASEINVVQVNGGVSLNKRSSSAANTAVTIAQKGGGSATLLPSPAILEREETKRAIEGDRAVAGVLELGRSASAYLFSAGLASPASVLVESGYLSSDDVAELVRKGAVGDVVGRYIDADGNAVDPALERRTVGIELAELRSVPVSIAVIAGTQKHAICQAVVTSGLCSVLVTDEENAHFLLDRAA